MVGKEEYAGGSSVGFWCCWFVGGRLVLDLKGIQHEQGGKREKGKIDVRCFAGKKCW